MTTMHESFSIVLPSDSSFDIYKDNTLSNYSITLSETINLNKNYEVGLTQIIYPQNIFNIPKDSKILIKAKIKKEEIILSSKTLMKDIYNNEQDLFTKLDTLIKEITFDEIDKKLKETFKNDKFTLAQLPVMKYENNYISCTNGSMKRNDNDKVIKIYFDFDSYLHYMLGFNENQLKDKKELAKYKIDLYGNLHTMFIYTDIIQPTFVGNKKANLLRVIALDSPKSIKINEMKTINFNPQIFLPLNKLSFDTIQIKILDNLGNFIQFENGKVIMTLMFRPIINS